jgi:hypothetical protein
LPDISFPAHAPVSAGRDTVLFKAHIPQSNPLPSEPAFPVEFFVPPSARHTQCIGRLVAII